MQAEESIRCYGEGDARWGGVVVVCHCWGMSQPSVKVNGDPALRPELVLVGMTAVPPAIPPQCLHTSPHHRISRVNGHHLIEFDIRDVIDFSRIAFIQISCISFAEIFRTPFVPRLYSCSLRIKTSI